MGAITVMANHLTHRRGKPVIEYKVPVADRAALGRSVFRQTFRTEREAILAEPALIEEWQAAIAAAAGRVRIKPNGAIVQGVAELHARVAALEAELKKVRAEAEFGDRLLAEVRGESKLHARHEVTLSEVTEEYIASCIRLGKWKATGFSDSTDTAIRRMIKLHASDLADTRIDRIAAADVQLLIEEGAPQRLRSTLQQIWSYAKICGYVTGDNPAAVENLSLPKPKPGDKQHHKAMPYQQVPAFFQRLAKIDSVPSAALRFTILTAARKGEVAGMKWDEIDLENRLWTVPACRMKAQREHVVPLSTAALEILKARKAAELPRHGGYVFPSRKGNAGLSHNGMDSILASLKVDATPHGFRSSFRDWCAETGQDDHAAECCLAHVVGGVRGAYLRTRMLEQRRTIMQQWANYLAGDKSENSVV